MNNKHGGFQGPVIAVVMVATMTMLVVEIAVGLQMAADNLLLLRTISSASICCLLRARMTVT